MCRFALLLFVFAIAAPGADTVHYYPTERGRTFKAEDVTVSRDTYETVVYQEKGGRTVTVEAERIQWIEYADASLDFLDGKKALDQGNYGDAVFFFERSREQMKGVRDWAKPYTYYHLGRSYHLAAESGAFDRTRYEKAIQFYEEAVLADPKTRFLRECHFYSAQCNIGLNKIDEAISNLDLLQNTVNEAQNATWAFRVCLWQGHISLKQGKYDEAIGRYEKAKRVGEGQAEAGLAIGKCYIEQKQFSQALRTFDEIKERGTPAIQAAAKNGIAACYLAQQDYQKARRVVLEVIVKYSAVSEYQPEAFFIAATCYENLKNREPGSLQRAMVYYKFLKTGYPTSPWARKAAIRLEELTRK